MYKTIFLTCLLVLSISAQGPAQDDLKLQQQQLSMKRTACLVLSRYHSNTHKDTLQQIIQELQPQLQQKYINKMYASAIQHCMPFITMDDAQKFFIQDPSFNPQQMFHYFQTFDYNIAEPNKLTKNQQNLVKFIKNFDEEMAVRRQQRQATKQQTQTSDSQFNMKFFGLTHQDIPSGAKYAYIAIFAIAVCGSIYYLMSKLDNKNQKTDKKKKKSSSASPTKQTVTPASPRGPKRQ